MRVATTLRAQASASSVAWPNGSTRLGWQRTSAAARKPGTESCGDEARDRDAGTALELRAERAVADEGQRSLAEPRERVRQPDDVLALDQRADADEGRAWPVGCGAERAEALEVDAAVHDLGLAARLRRALLELPAQPVRDRDHRGRATDDEAGRPADEGVLRQVRDVLSVRRDDERSSTCTRGEDAGEAGGEEEVRVDDVGTEAARGPDRAQRQAGVAQLAAAAAVDHDPLDRVPARRELPLEPLHEDAEVGRRRGRVHLGDEQDPHPGNHLGSSS